MSSLGTRLDGLGIAAAELRLHWSEAGRLTALSLLACNDAFADQTGIGADAGTAYAERAFGAQAAEAVASHETAAREQASVLTLFFQPTSRWFTCYSRRTEDVLELVLLDITSFRTESEFTQLRERAYRSFIEHLPMIAFLRVVSPEPVSLFTAGSFREITGYGPERGVEFSRWMEIVHPDDRDRVSTAAEKLYRLVDFESELEYRIVRADGATRWVRSYDRHFTSADGRLGLVQGLIQDVTERKQREDDLRQANEQIQEQNRMLARLARTDPLTGLLNRRAMQEQLERELRMLTRGRGTFSVLLLDLDRFKLVNDEHGHRAGDRVLMNLAETLSEHVRSSDVQARWGGEEFMVLFSGTRAEAARPVAQKLLDWFTSHPTKVDGTELAVSFTGGLVEAVEGDTVDSLFSRADKALYRGKGEGRNRIVTE